MNGVFLDYTSLDKQDLDMQALRAAFDALTLYPLTSADVLLERVADAEVIITNKVVINAETIRQCPQLKLILISATGTNNVDLAEARARGIVVCNCQAYGTSAVAQHTLMLMLNLATSFLSYQRAIQQGEWQKSTQFCLLDAPIVELAGKTLGIVGYGELGQAVARLAEAFGMQIRIAALPGRPADESRIPFAALLPQVDFLSLHCPLTEDTRHLISHAELDAMKPSAFLLNCARGGIVDEQALAQALREGKIAGAATDVLSVEPPKEGNVLLDASIPNLIVTPHNAWGSVDARQRIVDQLLENVEAFKQGQPIRQVN
ncbi:2-hydroxyacid dehydrogenase [Acinetobacter bohemicus]|uniref:2-hydroxyacid dehydrogenase n=1 Tax=Acinetobacter TaxID=469 RepID=UPI00118ECFEC|nr:MULTISPECIES: 2-hydroxyacid dehydrogenase [Acinetobacter]MCO8041373.1 2-hydroxyacid dehydrogenase [Acinetobacter sp. S4400-12]MCO8044836.1 2-hydroxyacid dehydrogenase [Acinetobacter sp. S4397-1]MCU7225669.1 2-hydroxyacid dehydrogenase [Acinetobacter bohemicus]TSH68855.1 2-hydroxyacid dehydrogenase [Acinetobacter sp. RF15A]TSI14474.1 2-hydroxyacid dehydrogenase [Acinetobacter sp. RF15B]